MSYKVLALLVTILTIGGGLGGQRLKLDNAKQPRYGLLIGPGCSSLDERHKDTGNWNIFPGYLVGGFVRKPLTSWLDAQAEIQFVSRRTYRIFDHPQPYVFDMKVDIDNKLLRLPVSLIIAQPLDHGIITAYMGAGLSLGTPLQVTMTKELRYQNQSVSTTQNILDQYPIPMIGYQALLGIKISPTFSELRFGCDFSSFNAPGLGLNELKQWEIWWLFGLTNKD